MKDEHLCVLNVYKEKNEYRSQWHQKMLGNEGSNLMEDVRIPTPEIIKQARD